MLLVTYDLRVYMERFMLQHGLSYVDAGRKAGVSYMTIRRIAKGAVQVARKPTVRALCKLFDVSEARLSALAADCDAPAEAEQCATPAPSALRHENAMALDLWNWLKDSAKHRAVVRALGYKGSLPGVGESDSS